MCGASLLDGICNDWGAVVTRKSRIRLSGYLQQLARGPALITDDGETWIIDLSEGLELPSSGNVVLEGVQAGLDRLQVDWIGPSSSS
jgi:hypothetical protein